MPHNAPTLPHEGHHAAPASVQCCKHKLQCCHSARSMKIWPQCSTSELSAALARLANDENDKLGYNLTRCRSPHCCCVTETCGITAASAPVDDGVDEDLDGVLVGEQMDDVKGVLDDAHCHQLLPVVPPVLHEGRRHSACIDGSLFSARHDEPPHSYPP